MNRGNTLFAVALSTFLGDFVDLPMPTFIWTDAAEDALVPILQHSWTIPMGLSFLAFFVFSPSCFATLAAIKREMGTWKAPAVLWVAYTLLAYAFSFVVYRTALWVCG